MQPKLKGMSKCGTPGMGGMAVLKCGHLSLQGLQHVGAGVQIPVHSSECCLRVACSSFSIRAPPPLSIKLAQQRAAWCSCAAKLSEQWASLSAQLCLKLPGSAFCILRQLLQMRTWPGVAYCPVPSTIIITAFANQAGQDRFCGGNPV